MMVDLLVHSAAQLLTLASSNGPKRGAEMRHLGIIEDGAVAIQDGRIVLTGTTAEVRATCAPQREIDATGRVVMPGFVDAHTHIVFAGDRLDEFEQRIAGATYLEIMASGGGIMSTVRATRAATVEELVAQSRARLDRMLAFGATTVEVKTGYGLTVEDELKMLKAIHRLDESHPADLVPTFLGAHAIPMGYEARADDYVDLVVEEMLPALSRARAGELSIASRPFVDVFCDVGAFTLEQSRRILQAARGLGFPLKIHADEFKALGGTALAAELGATSADHLAVTPDAELQAMAQSGTIPVLLPGTTFGLGSDHYADARKMMDVYKLPVALGSDLNPGTYWCESMPFVIVLACRYLRMTPAEAVVASTLNAAYAVGRGEEVGSVQVGKKADLLILAVSDYRHLGYRINANLVERVIKNGDEVSDFV